MLNAKGEPTWMIALTPADMELFYDMATIEKKVPKKILSALANKTKLVCIPPESRVIPPFKDWILQPATQLDYSEIYYCVMHGWHNRNYPPQPLVSYQYFLDET